MLGLQLLHRVNKRLVIDECIACCLKPKMFAQQRHARIFHAGLDDGAIREAQTCACGSRAQF